ncbi:Zn-ribbon domain-containing OB-fold protein [Niveispirillum fermenti]|uniref:Zn-ribbon domain-containing OB-fold protein n=1 Tax=Niveispirillum fermenti TaxID=1233113 RepID=UPI003A8AF7C0
MIQPEAEWRAFLAQGRFMIQRSASTGAFVFHPRIAAPGTGAEDLEWVEAAGTGTVHATTAIQRRDPAENYNVALIDLDEGPRLMSRVIDIAPEAVAIGARVRARIIQEEGQPLLVFVPA